MLNAKSVFSQRFDSVSELNYLRTTEAENAQMTHPA